MIAQILLVALMTVYSNGLATSYATINGLGLKQLNHISGDRGRILLVGGQDLGVGHPGGDRGRILLVGGHGQDLGVGQPAGTVLHVTSGLHGAVPIQARNIVDESAPPHYSFKYGVEDAHTGDRKQQSEERKDDRVVGEYSLVEPDGTIRVVKYTADDQNGFNAVVSRIGHAVHPQIIGHRSH